MVGTLAQRIKLAQLSLLLMASTRLPREFFDPWGRPLLNEMQLGSPVPARRASGLLSAHRLHLRINTDEHRGPGAVGETGKALSGWLVPEVSSPVLHDECAVAARPAQVLARCQVRGLHRLRAVAGEGILAGQHQEVVSSISRRNFSAIGADAWKVLALGRTSLRCPASVRGVARRHLLPWILDRATAPASARGRHGRRPGCCRGAAGARPRFFAPGGHVLVAAPPPAPAALRRLLGHLRSEPGPHRHHLLE
mmetsp:Transcript_70245/g.194293  ORF Transcript_70245/g.194293 Transcript_70245/m.194293 type:complete len:252 (+) Transcript_70245:231-986(+)